MRWRHSKRRWGCSRESSGHHIIEPLERRVLFAVFNVNSTADILSPPPGVVTLRAAIQAANASPGNNTIDLTVPGTYRITIAGAGEDGNASGDFDILSTSTSTANAALSILNTSGGSVVIDANRMDRAFDINPGFNPGAAGKPFAVTMQGFAIENGYATAAFNPDGPGASGGGIRVNGNASLMLSNMMVTNNAATADGGGVSMENTLSEFWTLTLNNSTISDNHAGDAGGGVESDGSGTINIDTGSAITANTSLNLGGGICLDAIQNGFVFQSATLNLLGAVVGNNSSLAAGALGGGIGVAGNSAVSINNSTISGNFAAGSGGAFADENAQDSLALGQSLILNNSASGSGGGFYATGRNASLFDSQFQDNSAGNIGGGVFAGGASLSVVRCTFAGNTAAAAGGGAEIQTSATGALASGIIESTFTANSALNNSGTPTGGAIDAPAAFTGALSLLNDTIDRNSASDGGGIFWAEAAGSSVTVQNTILAANRAATAPDANNPAGTFTDLGGNLIGVTGAGSGNTGFAARTTFAGTAAAPLDPQLGPLTDNNGPTTGAPSAAITLQTEAPLAGSPAIGQGLAGAAPATDERGFASVVGGLVNIGAVSAGAASITGSVFNDVNHDGIRGAAEPALAGVTVYLDANNNGILDPGETSATTGASGNYSFPNLFPGKYIVRQLVPPGYALTAPLGYSRTFTPTVGQAVNGPVFGDVLISSVTMDLSYLLTVTRNFGKAGTFATGDVNGDGTVNQADFLLVARNYGHALPAPMTAASAAALAAAPGMTTVKKARR